MTRLCAEKRETERMSATVTYTHIRIYTHKHHIHHLPCMIMTRLCAEKRETERMSATLTSASALTDQVCMMLVYVYVCIRMYVCMYISMFCECTDWSGVYDACVCVCVCILMYVCMYISMFCECIDWPGVYDACVCVCVCIRMYVCMYTDVLRVHCVHIHTYISHWHTHTTSCQRCREIPVNKQSNLRPNLGTKHTHTHTQTHN